MGVFPGEDANLPTQLWIVARYMQSLSLLVALLFLRRKLNASVALLCYSVVTAFILAAIFADIFPMCFVEGRGLTSFKTISEYIISLILLAATLLLLKNRKAFDKKVLSWLVMSIIMTIAAEMAFTFYVSVYGFSNMAGHLFKILAFYLIYKAIVETGLEKPHRLLFLNLKESEESVRTALGEVRRLATIDFLTGLYNRRHFFEMAAREFQRARRYGQSLCAMMLDLDHFKSVNDTYGHAVGDEVLKEIAECCRRELRGVDVVGRYGGEEFAIMLPEIDLSTAFQVAERLRRSVAGKTVDARRSLLVITVSIGVSAVEDEDLSVEDVIGRADEALYSAKRGGRNRVCSG
jgi:diguanylate cyclase (GGDEF)-like protein